MSQWLPSKELVAILDERVGKRFTTGLIRLLWAVLAAGLLYALAALAWRMYDALPDTVPEVPGQPREWLVPLGVVVLYTLGFSVIQRQIRKIAKVVLDTQAAANATETLNDVERRLAYIEDKVGDELVDLVARQRLQEQGIQLEDFRRVAAAVQIPPPADAEQQLRVNRAVTVLRDAAAEAHEIAQGRGGDVGQRAATYAQIQRVIHDLLSYRVATDYAAWDKMREKKAEIRGVQDDGRPVFQAVGNYLRGIADKLTIQDLDPTADIPRSFAEYRRRWE